MPHLSLFQQLIRGQANGGYDLHGSKISGEGQGETELVAETCRST